MKDLTKFIKFFLQLACLVAVDLSAFYTSLFIAWIIRAEFMPYFIPGLPVFHFSYLYFISFWWVPAIFIFFIFYESLYDRTCRSGMKQNRS